MDPIFKVLWGSQLYGLTNPKSDKDYLCIYSPNHQEEIDLLDDNHISTDDFCTKLQQHDLKVLECYFSQHESARVLRSTYVFDLDLQKLRHSVSAVVSNAHVKAKKKFRDNEVYIGLKSYYHCIRILTMMNYLARHGTFDPSSFYNELFYIYQDIVIKRQNDDPETLFLELEQDYKKMLKSLQSTFRAYCPK